MVRDARRGGGVVASPEDLLPGLSFLVLTLINTRLTTAPFSASVRAVPPESNEPVRQTYRVLIARDPAGRALPPELAIIIGERSWSCRN